LFERLHDITRCHQIQTRDLAVARAHHSVRLTTSGLAIGKASCVRTFKCAAN